MATDTITVIYQVEAGKSEQELKSLERQLKKTEGVFVESQKTVGKASKARQQLLKEEIQDLRELRGRAKAAFTTKEVEQFNKRIAESEKNVKTLGGSLKKTGREGGRAVKFLSGQLRNLAVTIGAAFAVRKLLRFGVEAVKLAGKVEGVQAAFDKLNDPSLLAKLRKATQGTVSDVVLMQKAVQASNFKIPLEQLGKFFEFARRRAAGTGESVEFLTNSIVIGLGRKSAKIIDNLGISLLEVQKELKLTGDFTQAVSNIIDREFETMAEDVDTTADKIARFNAELDNTSAKLGAIFISLGSFLAPAPATDQFIVDVKEAAGVVGLTADEIDRLVKSIDEFGRQGVKAASRGEGFRILRIMEELAEETAEGMRIMESFVQSFPDPDEDFAVPPKAVESLKSLSEELKFARDEFISAATGTEFFFQAQQNVERIEKRIKEVLGNTNDEFERRLQLIRKLGREAQEFARDQEKDAEDAAKAVTAQLEGEIDEREALGELFNELNEEESEKEAERRKIRNDEQDKENKEFFQGILDRRKAEKEDFEERKKGNEQFTQDLINQSNLVTDLIITNQRRTLDADIESQQRQFDNRIITFEEFQENVKNLQREQAQREKALAVFESGIKLALAVLAALVKDPTGILAARVAFLGSVEVLAIQATPIPQFKEGGVDIMGPRESADGGFSAILHPNESVIPAKATAKYKTELNAMMDGTYRDLVDNQLSDYIAAELKALNINISGASGKSNEIQENRVITGIKGGTKQSVTNTDRIVKAMQESDMQKYRYDKRF